MKKLCMLLVPLFILGLVFMACDSTTTNKNDTANNSFEETGTIQGTVYDAVTGEAIGDDSLEITMVMGKDYKSPAVLKKDPTKAFLGDFAFTNVPVTLSSDGCDGDYTDCHGTAYYRVVATMDGYERFEGYTGLETDMYDNENSFGYSGQNNDIPTQNKVYNRIQNIYLYPLGSTAPDYTVYVEYDHERVPGATVFFEYKPNDDAVTNTDDDFRMCPVEALGRTLTGTTDANGMVTFAGSNLVLGGWYRLTVLPVVYDGVQLGLKNVGSWFRVGLDDTDFLVFLQDLEHFGNSDGLVIVSASNRDQSHLVPSGVLTVSFNQAVTLMDETNCSATLVTPGVGLLNVTDAPDSTVTVTGDGTSTLTFTPNIATALDATDVGAYVQFGACNVYVGDDAYDGVNIFSEVLYLDNSNISNRVYMTANE
jgi:hypothetical protein